MSHYIHSGVNRPDLVDLLAQEGALGMVNVRVIGEPRLQAAFSRFPQVPLFLDSGFRYTMDAFRYLEAIECCGERFTWISNLDQVGNQQASDAHYHLLTSRLSSHDLRAKVLWIYQGGDRAELRSRVKDHALIGIGGCVLRMRHTGVPATLSWLMEIGEILAGEGAQAHIFGVGNKTMIEALGCHPWVASLDSSKWLMAYRAALWLRPDGTTLQAPDRSRRACAANNIRVIEGWLHPSLLN